VDKTTESSVAADSRDESQAAAWRTWLAVGCTGFGGPAGQLAILHREIVERRKWLDEDEFLAAMKVCMLLPGPEAQQVATYAGWRIGGLAGGLSAGSLFILPGAVLVTALAWGPAVRSIRAGSMLGRALHGVGAAVVAAIAILAWRLAQDAFLGAGRIDAGAVAVAAVAAGALGWAKVPTPLVVLAAAAVGMLRSLV